MNNSEVWEAMKILNEIRSRLSIAIFDNSVRQFIKEFLIDHQNEPEYISRFVSYIQYNQPKYVDYLAKLLILL